MTTAKLSHIVRLHAVIERSLFRTDSRMSYLRTIGAIRQLAEACLTTEVETEVWAYVGDLTSCCVGDLLEGAYCWLAANRAGQSSHEYEALSAISRVYNPGPFACEPEPESSAADVYCALTEKMLER